MADRAPSRRTIARLIDQAIAAARDDQLSAVELRAGDLVVRVERHGAKAGLVEVTAYDNAAAIEEVRRRLGRGHA